MGGVSGLAEVVLWARDLDRSLAFYEGLMGLEAMSGPELPTRFLRLGEAGDGVPSMLVLVPHPDPGGRFPRAKPERVLHHLALSVSPDRYQALMARLGAAGLEVRGGVHPVLKGVRTFYVDDPDGNEVECIAPEPEAEA
ncbi:MAG: VOC family protein [Candidatus Dormibacterales bacterium]